MSVVTGRTRVAGVVGAPIRHSLSPSIHNAWLTAAGLDGVYVPFAIAPDRFETFIDANRGGGLVGVNVTLPFKARALDLADRADDAARAAGAANLLLFEADGAVTARNTDGIGLLQAFAEQAPTWRASHRPVVVLGAGGAALGAVATLCREGARVRVVNRTVERAQALARRFERVEAFALTQVETALVGAGALINAASVGLGGESVVDLPLKALPPDAVVMDMVYAPLETALLQLARRLGLVTVDGLAMLIGQARPSFEALFAARVPADVDVRTLAVAALEAAG